MRGRERRGAAARGHDRRRRRALRPLLVLRELAALRVRRARHPQPTTRAASPSPAACRTTAVRRAAISRTRSRRWSSACAPSPARAGLVSGVGMHMTKHVFGVYAAAPGPVAPPDADRVQAAVDRAGAPEVVAEHDGDATVAAYSVVHGRDGAPEWALLVCDLAGGKRTYAQVRDAMLCARGRGERARRPHGEADAAHGRRADGTKHASTTPPGDARPSEGTLGVTQLPSG